MTNRRFFILSAGKRVEVSADDFAKVENSSRAPRGLGDLVATVAEPIARVSDALLGTHLVGCQSCAERRAALNRIVPKL